MYDKQVRRRRLTLAAFVVASLLLLTAYFGEGSGGGLHSVQRGALSVFGPIQEGAHRALKPVRDLFGWVGDTLDAKEERDELAEENEELTQQITELEAAATDNEDLRRLLQINDSGMDDYEPVPALVYSRSPNPFYSKVQIDKGESAGVEPGQPVINGYGLVGRVTEVSQGYSEVTLLTDASFAAGARVLTDNATAQQTTVRASVNKPDMLELTFVDNAEKVSRGDKVVTTGSTSGRFPSYFPRDLLVGTVSDVELGEGSLDSRIRVLPAVDLGDIEYVEVLTGVESPRGHMNGQMIGRLSALALFGVVVQVAAISQIEFFGVPPDVTPLLVAAVGLLLGSVTGAGFGFFVGLLMDTALLQTLGVTSLLLVAIGYGAGRLRELRDPAHGLVPMAVGAAAATIATFGFAVLQFLLGDDVPMSLLLLRDILLGIVLGTLLALPVHAITRRVVEPYVPDDPRRRRRRAYTTGGLSPLSRS